MAIETYLAMTAAEIGFFSSLPQNLCWMACHFSPYGTGLTNLPRSLPKDSFLILNDRTPMWGHDPGIIAAQLQERVEGLRCRGVLLDFQRPDISETAALAKHLTEVLPCPVGVSESYAKGLDCPVFLPPVPVDISVEEYLTAWKNREIWLETALEGKEITLTPEGAASTPLPHTAPPEGCHRDEKLHCHYRITLREEIAQFSLHRTREDVQYLLEDAEKFGVTLAVGLWQEFAGHKTL